LTITANDVRAAFLIIENEKAYLDAHPSLAPAVKLKRMEKWVVMESVIIGLGERIVELEGRKA
jgi:hypothetical protein